MILNCIVKNEEKIIERMLKSVVNIITFFVIIDTGSSDNTIEKIKNFFSNYNIKGIIKKSIFINFEHNRNEALELCYKTCDKNSYILLMDADMVLETNTDIKKLLLNDCYTIVQEDETYSYRNIRIIKNNNNYRYKGYTHEALISKETYDLPYDKIKIIDKQDGGSKKNKLMRDIKLLSSAIKDFPNEPRNYFYIANTYFSLWEIKKATEYYHLRIDMGGWIEELWYCYYRLSQIYFSELDYAKGISYSIEAYQINPNRLENIYVLYNFYTERKCDEIANIWKDILIKKKNINYDKFLFANKLIYLKIKNI